MDEETQETKIEEEEIEEYELIEETEEKPKKPEKTKIVVKEEFKEEQNLLKCPYCESEDIRYDFHAELYACLNCGKVYIYEEREKN